MKAEQILKKFNIRLIEELSHTDHIILSDNIARIVSDRFEFIKYEYIYSKMMKAKIFFAKIPQGITRAIYSYEEDTLIISDEEDINNVSEELLYECIHTVQDIRNRSGKIKRLGQCTFSEFKAYAMALNEVSIQYIVSKILKNEIQNIEAYGINTNTFSENKYPLICNILLQLLFVSNEKALVESTIYSKDEFIINVIDEIGESNYKTIQENLDQMLYASEEIIGIKTLLKYQSVRLKDEEINQNLNNIYKKEELIRKLYMESQLIIFTNYFDRLYLRIEDLSDIKIYKNRLEEYGDLVGFYTDGREKEILKYYEQYCYDKSEKLVLKEADIKRRNDLALTVVQDNIITQIYNRIKQAISNVVKKA